MQILTILKLSAAYLLCAASYPTLSFPHPPQKPASHSPSLGTHAPPTYQDELLKRAGRPTVDSRITLHPLRITAYIGVRTILENIYLRIIAEAANRDPGELTSHVTAQYGGVVVTLDSDLHFNWGFVHEFASTMLDWVFNGDQNFYIADIVADMPGGLGQGAIRYMMGTPATRQETADEVWAAIVAQWLASRGL